MDFVIETNRGHDLGKIIKNGRATENTGVPGVIKGYGRERVIYAPTAGIINIIKDIGSFVKKDEILAYIGEIPVRATITGLVRGMIRNNSFVKEGLKISDIDPREEELKNCFTISDKARTISGSVAEVIFNYLFKKSKGEEK